MTAMLLNVVASDRQNCSLVNANLDTRGVYHVPVMLDVGLDC